ncbi:hypothetical protein [Polyangium sp. 6x1]|uniref:hypothetical protein n=1 Tax=Polyangium sp. 6x1 TaxID=3042689 RepID=UPI002482A3FC|nr:hypothetical protein [Polyangium sp. 6x1]MDI1444034.1 hypothetical protein [Polyangium sp. 6x1]
MLTVEALFAQPDNATVLRHLKLRSPEDVTSFEAGTDGSPYDEGGQLFFHKYGRACPDATRCAVNICNIMAHERTARIFALHQGRFTLALRLPVDGDDRERLCGWTADGTVDLRALGPDWVLFHGYDGDGEDEEYDPFLRAYELAGHQSMQTKPENR